MKIFEIEYDLGFAIVVCESIERAKILFSMNEPSFKIRGILELENEVFYNVEN